MCLGGVLLSIPPPPPPLQPGVWGVLGGRVGGCGHLLISPRRSAVSRFSPLSPNFPDSLQAVRAPPPPLPLYPPPHSHVCAELRASVPPPPQSGGVCRVGFKSVFTQLGDFETRPRKAIKRCLKSSCPRSTASPSAGGGICPPCAARGSRPPPPPLNPPPSVRPSADTRKKVSP